MIARRVAWPFFLLALSSCAPSPKAPEQATLKEAPPPAHGAIGELAPDEPHTALAVEADDAALGAPTADVTLVAFLDFQCGFCASGFRTIMGLRDHYSDSQLRIVFKHMPLESHELAFPAAVVGQAVTLGAGHAAFFDFASHAFNNQAAIDQQSLVKWAEDSGLDRSAFNRLAGKEETARRVVQDVVVGRRVGVDATPTFFINGRLLPGAQPAALFRQMIDEELDWMKGAPGEFRAKYQARVAKNMSGSLVEALLSQDPNDYRVPIDGSPVAGNPHARVTLVAFSDYECPFCKKADDTVAKLRLKYKDDLRVVFKHLPLSFHESARPAALIAAAVQKYQGDDAFFAVSAAIFAANPQLDRDTLKKLGMQHGLSASQATAALQDTAPALQARLQQDADLADDVLARGTPHFFINGKRLSGARPIEQFEALIEYEIDRANATMKKTGVGLKDIYASLQAHALSPGIPDKIDSDVSVPTAGHPSRGPKDAPVTVHVFSDFECPYCRQGEANLAELEQTFGKKLRFVWHDFPLPFHERAIPAARAAREAYLQQGDVGFWKMHTALFQLDGSTPKIKRDEILAHAKAQGLNVPAMTLAIDSEKHDAAIQKDLDFASSVGIQGTPAFLINRYLITGAKPVRFLQRIVEKALSESVQPKQ